LVKSQPIWKEVVSASHQSTNASNTIFLCAKKEVVLIVIIEIIEFDAIPIQKSSSLIGGD
jgi:hypothetical protein